MRDHEPSVEKYGIGARLDNETRRSFEKWQQKNPQGSSFNQETRKLTIRSLDQFEPRDIEWLWNPLIPLRHGFLPLW